MKYGFLVVDLILLVFSWCFFCNKNCVYWYCDVYIFWRIWSWRFFRWRVYK